MKPWAESVPFLQRPNAGFLKESYGFSVIVGALRQEKPPVLHCG
jgi:hypothetical protein